MIYWITGIVILIADQAAKQLIRMYLAVGESMNIVGNFFRLTHVENAGAAFGSMEGSRWFLVLLPVIFIVCGVFYMKKNKDEHWTVYLSITAITAGGIGNLIDRVLAGTVTDMFDFSIFPPVFNIADIAITLGCALLVFGILFGEKLKKRNGK